MTGCEKYFASLAKSLLNDIVTSPDPLSERAVDILDALRTEANNRHPRHPMIISMLKSTDLTKVLTKTVHVCKRQMRRTRNSKPFDEFGEWDKAMQSAEVLLSFFKEATDNQVGGKKESVKSVDDNAVSEVLISEIKPRQTVCTEVELATERLQRVDTSIEYGGDDRGDDRNFVSPTPTRSLLLGDNGKCTDSSPDDTSTDIMVSAEYAPLKDDNESIACDTEDDCVEESNDQCSIIDDDQILNTTIKATIYNEDTLPESRYKVTQRVYAKDDSTGLLYPAFVRKVMWGPKVDSTKLIVNDQSVVENDDEDDDEDEDVRRWSPKYNTFHYYVHFYGWAVSWDRWVHQEYLYEDSEFTLSLSKLLTSEYKKVQPKKGQRMSLIQMATWMKRIVELEAELKMTENEMGENYEGKRNITTDNSNVEESKTDVECATVKFVQDNKTMHYASATVKKVTEDDNCRIRVRVKVCTSKPCDNQALDLDSAMEAVVDEPVLPIITTAILQKQSQLHESGLKMKHKKHLSDQLTLPFNLKKILVEEWEVITQCNMLHNVPCNTSVRKALNVYLESKLEPLRNERANESGANAGDKVGCTKVKTTDDDVGKEWIDMVEGIALFFDQALPAHLLFNEERGQYDSLCRQIRTQRRNFAVAASAASMTLEGSSTAMALSSDGDGKSPSNNNILPERMSEIYGCEHLIRLFLRLPGVIAESSTMTGMEARRVFAKVGDLVRFLQKNQSLFESSFRKPLAGEMRRGCSNGVGGKRKRRSKK
jgi:hypothetical protein